MLAQETLVLRNVCKFGTELAINGTGGTNTLQIYTPPL